MEINYKKKYLKYKNKYLEAKKIYGGSDAMTEEDAVKLMEGSEEDIKKHLEDLSTIDIQDILQGLGRGVEAGKNVSKQVKLLEILEEINLNMVLESLAIMDTTYSKPILKELAKNWTEDENNLLHKIFHKLQPGENEYSEKLVDYQTTILKNILEEKDSVDFFGVMVGSLEVSVNERQNFLVELHKIVGSAQLEDLIKKVGSEEYNKMVDNLLLLMQVKNNEKEKKKSHQGGGK